MDLYGSLALEDCRHDGLARAAVVRFMFGARANRPLPGPSGFTALTLHEGN